MSEYFIKSGLWSELKLDAEKIRRQVFIQEQSIPEQDEWDALDAVSLHFVVYDRHLENDLKINQAIATARLLENNSIGRVAVLKSYRSKGVGRLIMQQIIEHARTEKRQFLKLSSQLHAIAFYESFGFQVKGVGYLDCGIPHIDMYLELIKSEN